MKEGIGEKRGEEKRRGEERRNEKRIALISKKHLQEVLE